ncbi:hypothetical protein [Anderseniella sp. Alg231-50]|uniref:hypothetical protein n=1 Tax=Anderseniella sp. Alg231-50 TaxID=1922226 RepID=UPI00307B8996
MNEEQLEKLRLGLCIAVHLREQGGDVDAVLACLRHHQYFQSDCIVVLREMDEIDLGEAKRIVLLSPVWRDRLSEHETMVDKLLGEIEDEGMELDG